LALKIGLEQVLAQFSNLTVLKLRGKKVTNACLKAAAGKAARLKGNSCNTLQRSTAENA